MLQSGQMPNAAEQKQHQNGHKPHSESMEEEQQHTGTCLDERMPTVSSLVLGNHMMEI